MQDTGDQFMATITWENGLDPVANHNTRGIGKEPVNLCNQLPSQPGACG